MSENEKTSSNSFNTWVSSNLWPIICSVAVVGAGYGVTNFRISQNDHRYETITQQLDRIERRLAASDTADQCQVRTLDKLADRAGIEPPCQLEKNP